MKKYEIEGGSIEGAVDNLTVVNRINGGHNNLPGPKATTATDCDVWDETMALLDRLPAIYTL